ncbi:MAG: (2Fe-2S)-binding protein [Bacteroidales bacterium]|jgi:ferredoxin|nr:(2Fe-2S)-binding protein [Bacteroidales bacterium]
MNITINNHTIEVLNGETLIETARRAGYDIPSLCYAKEAKHKSSCMVCAVKNTATGQVIPSCTTIPTEGMSIETESEEIRLVRTLSLELLLSDHRADCEAPCSMVCPQGLDIERMLAFYDNGRHQEARSLLEESFSLPEIACDNCKVPCEKTCRRGTVDKAVPIRTIIRELVGMETSNPASDTQKVVQKTDKSIFQSRLGRFTIREKERLKTTTVTPSGCLHCACAGRSDCKLRVYATDEKIKRSRYDLTSALPAMERMHIKGDMWFEQSKCIRCGICVYNSDNGFTFKDRGFGMQVILPEENRENISEELAGLCPTGAIYRTEFGFDIQNSRFKIPNLKS